MHNLKGKAVRGGVLRRAGQTEGSVDLARLAGLQPAGVICEIMNEDGTMARVPELTKFAKTHKLKMVTVKASRSLSGLRSLTSTIWRPALPSQASIC